MNVPQPIKELWRWLGHVSTAHWVTSVAASVGFVFFSFVQGVSPPVALLLGAVSFAIALWLVAVGPSLLLRVKNWVSAIPSSKSNDVPENDSMEAERARLVEDRSSGWSESERFAMRCLTIEGKLIEQTIESRLNAGGFAMVNLNSLRNKDGFLDRDYSGNWFVKTEYANILKTHFQPSRPKEPPAGLRIVEKSRAFDGGQKMIQELIDSCPSINPLNRAVANKWGKKCVVTLRELLSDDHEDEWLKIHAKLWKADDPSIDPDEAVIEKIEEVAIQLKALFHRFNHTMLRRTARMTSGEHNSLYPPGQNP